MKQSLKLVSLCMLILSLMLAGCKSLDKISLRNLVSLYQPEKQFAELEAWLYHSSDTVSTLFVRVNYNNLVYQKDPFTGLYACSYRLGYTLTSGYDSKEILETSTLLSGDSINYGRSASVIHSFELKAKYPGNYLIEINLTDFNRQEVATRFIPLVKNTLQGKQNYILTDRNNSLIFKSYLPEGEKFRIQIDEPDKSRLFVNYYNREFPPARPPYSEDKEPVFEFKPDSVFVVSIVNGETDWLELPGLGFYHFRKDTAFREGLTLFRFAEGYPEVATVQQLRAPLRYITTRKEYDSLFAASNVKAAVDEFWLKTARSPERARNLIQKYYSQVEESNRYFTSYMEGWKTDRGLIYTVFGRPKYIYRGDGIEEWIYGEPQNRSSLRYTFIQVNNPFTDNDFMLLRSPAHKDPWFITVQSWRR